MGSRLLPTLAAVMSLVLAACSTGGTEGTSNTLDGSSSTSAPPVADQLVTTAPQEPSPVSPVEPPDDALTVDVQGIVSTVPQGWEVDRPPEEDGIVQVSARGQLPGDLPASLQVVTVPTERSSGERWTQEARTIGPVSQEWTFTMPTLSTRGSITLLDVEHTAEDVRGWLLVFEHEDGRTYNVTLTSPSDDFDERHAAVILGTVRDA